MADELISKAELSRMLKVDRSAINYYIKAGVLTDEALEGEGRKQKIRRDVALAQLNDRRDLVQAAANGKAEIDPPADTSKQQASHNNSANEVRDEYKAAQLKGIQLRNEELEEKRRAAAGTYVLASEVSGAFMRTIGQMVGSVDSVLPDWASELASEFELDQREVLHRLRGLWREHREAIAKSQADLARQLDRTVGDDDTASEPGSAGSGSDGPGDQAGTAA